MPHDLFVFKEMHILTFSGLIKVNVKDVNILSVTYALKSSLSPTFMSLANFELILLKNSLK